MKRGILIFFLIVTVCANAAVIFVVNSGSETLSKIDTETGEVNNAFASLGSMPNRVVVNQEFAYVVNSGDNDVQKISCETGQTVENIFLESSANPYDLYEHDGFLYVTGSITNQLYKIDLQTDTLVEQITVGSNPAGIIALDGFLYVGNTDYMGGYSNCSVMKIELSSFSIVATIPTHANPQYLSSANGYIHVSCTGNWDTIMGAVQIIDPNEEEVLETLNIGGLCWDIAPAGSDLIYLGDAMNTAVYAYNANTLEVLYDPENAFTPGGSIVEANDQFLAVMGGEWGQNFTVHLFDNEENHIIDYNVGLYATDMKFMPQVTEVTEEELQPAVSLTCGPNPFTDNLSFKLNNTRSEIKSITIYDVKGRKVKELSNCKSWNGTNNKNQSAPQGIYFARIKTSDGENVNTKILKIK